MLQAASSTTTAPVVNTADTGNSESPIIATPEEKSQRRRSTFYVPLVIEDEEETKKDTPADHLVQKSSSNTSLSSNSNSLTNFETKSSKSYSLRKSSSVKSGVAKVSALFERKTPSKMSPPCGFNWSISGSENTAQYSDTDDDEENSTEARHREQLLKTLPSGNNNSTTASPSKLKRYGIVLNVISLNGSDNEQSSLGSNGSSMPSMPSMPNGQNIPNAAAPRTHFNEENDIVLATPPPPKQQALSAAHESNDYDDDSEISRMQTNTSTPIKLMKSRSRTNILAVPLPSVERGLATTNTTPNNNNINGNSNGSTSNTTTTTTTTTLITLRAKSKTLPQNLSPSVVLREAAALDELEKKREKYQEKQEKREKLQEKQRQLFGGSTASQIAGSSPYKLQNSCSATSILTHSFPPKNLFLLKSTPKLSTDIAAATPPNTSAICSPPKKSLSFIRRAHSTKVARSNSLLKPNQAGILGSGSGSNGLGVHQGVMQGALSISCAGDNSSNNGSWGKHFYQPYDVCPLSLDELNCYFQADQCEKLICERFKIRDLAIHMASASAIGADLSVTTENETTATADDDAGHHSGRSIHPPSKTKILCPCSMGSKYYIHKYFLWHTTEKQPLCDPIYHFISIGSKQFPFVSSNGDRIWYSPICAGSR